MHLLHVCESDISSNARLKIYPSATIFQVCNYPIFHEAGYESSSRLYSVPSKGHAKDEKRSKLASMHRARSAVHDIALCNSFEYFFTLTFSPDKIDRYDATTVKTVLSDFLKNQVRRKDFSYVCIPEYHKDGAIHVHGLCNLGSMAIAPSFNPHTQSPVYTQSGQMVYNLLDWKLGFSTCIRIDEQYERTCNYITKYITKDTRKIFGKWYWSSRDLKKRPDISLVEYVDYDKFISDNHMDYTIPLYKDVKLSCLTIERRCTA